MKRPKSEFLVDTDSDEALSLLMRKYYEPIRASVTKIIGNREDADEITNETFLKALNKRNTIKNPKKIAGWLYITARNAAIDRLRNNQQDVNQIHEVVSLYNVDGERETAEASLLVAQQAQQTETELYLLRSLLRLLPEKDLEVVNYLLDDLKPKQIAEAIGSTAEAVQKRWKRILKWLRPIACNLDNQPLKKISEKLGISPHDIEVCVKRVIKRWKKSVT